jgi:hypothetical protein
MESQPLIDPKTTPPEDEKPDPPQKGPYDSRDWREKFDDNGYVKQPGQG